jgi:psiF repeat
MAAPAADAKPTAKAARAQCQADAKAQGLKGDARKSAVEDCFAKARPDLAAADKCRKDGKDKNLAGKELKAFVKECVAGAQ